MSTGRTDAIKIPCPSRAKIKSKQQFGPEKKKICDYWIISIGRARQCSTKPPGWHVTRGWEPALSVSLCMNSSWNNDVSNRVVTTCWINMCFVHITQDCVGTCMLMHVCMYARAESWICGRGCITRFMYLVQEHRYSTRPTNRYKMKKDTEHQTTCLLTTASIMSPELSCSQ